MDNRNYQFRFEKELNEEVVDLSERKDIKVHINEFTAVLIKKNVVKKLYLSFCDLGDEEMRVFADVIKENKSITVLWLDGNQIGDAGAKYISEAIKENKSITELDLCYNPISSKLRNLIQIQLNRNKYHKKPSGN